MKRLPGRRIVVAIFDKMLENPTLCFLPQEDLFWRLNYSGSSAILQAGVDVPGESIRQAAKEQLTLMLEALESVPANNLCTESFSISPFSSQDDYTENVDSSMDEVPAQHDLNREIKVENSPHSFTEHAQMTQREESTTTAFLRFSRERLELQTTEMTTHPLVKAETSLLLPSTYCETGNESDDTIDLPMTDIPGHSNQMEQEADNCPIASQTCCLMPSTYSGTAEDSDATIDLPLVDIPEKTDQLQHEENHGVSSAVNSWISQFGVSESNDSSKIRPKTLPENKKKRKRHRREKIPSKVQDKTFYKRNKLGFVVETPKSAAKFVCNTCDRGFVYKASFIKHVEAHKRETDENCVCKVCGKHFGEQSELVEHKCNPAAEKRFACKQCHFTFVYKSSLVRHVRTHLGQNDEKYVCKQCGELFTQQAKLADHEESHAFEETFVCKQCNDVFYTKSQFASHQRTHTHTYRCKTCGKTSFRQEMLKEHKCVRKKKHLCMMCGKAFHGRSALVNHERIHTGERPFVCEICGSTFLDRSTLRSHRFLHAGIKPHVCSVCGKGFEKRSRLIYHDRAIHKRIKDYVCKTCGKAFARQNELRGHERTHTREKPHVCNTCGRAFGFRTALICHKRIHTGEKPYVCQFCGWKFTKNYPLTYHLKAKHKDELQRTVRDK